jgi:hypothetical protein
MALLLILFDTTRRKADWLAVQRYFHEIGVRPPRNGAKKVRVRVLPPSAGESTGDPKDASAERADADADVGSSLMKHSCGTVSRPCDAARPKVSDAFTDRHQTIAVSGTSTGALPWVGLWGQFTQRLGRLQVVR